MGLRHHYISLEKNGVYNVKPSSPTHFNQYLHVSLYVLYALVSFVRYVVTDKELREKLVLMLEETSQDIKELSLEAHSDDYAEL